MSKWFTPELDDIKLDDNNPEVNIYVTSDDDGSIYAVIPFDTIKELCREIKDRESNA